MFSFNDIQFEFVWMGLFTTKEKWIHPKRTESTYEIIYVVKGVVNIAEGDESYSLQKGELLILRPNVTHFGTLESVGETSFYWLHFHCDKAIAPHYVKCFNESHLFKELLHYRNMPNYNESLVNAIFLHLLYSIKQADVNAGNNALAKEVCEWVRINADAKLTVASVAEHFGYNSEYISRAVAKSCGASLIKVIDRCKISRINDLLCNTHFYVKEIARMLGFSDSGALINFYKYHQKMSPSEYRNLYSGTHMNKK